VFFNSGPFFASLIRISEGLMYIKCVKEQNATSALHLKLSKLKVKCLCVSLCVCVSARASVCVHFIHALSPPIANA
jgi:hypothetical protein